MATGDQNDFLARLKSYLPRGWFGDFSATPIVNALLAGVSAVFSVTYALYIYARAQTRILTASDGWLDLISQDFFGGNLPRKNGELDSAFRARIIAAMFQQRATRTALTQVLTALTGYAPVIFEASRPYDTGAMHAAASAGYCGVARMGSLATPYTVFVTAYRPVSSGGSLGAAFADAPALSAMQNPLSASYATSLTQSQRAASDADIYAAVNATRAAGVTAWVAITNHS